MKLNFNGECRVFLDGYVKAVFEPPKPEAVLLNFTFNENTVTKYTGPDGVSIVIPSSYSINENGQFIEGNDYVVTSTANGVIDKTTTPNYTEVIFPDSIINFNGYTLPSQQPQSCKRIVTGNGFGVGTLGTYPFGYEMYCDIIEVGTGLTKIDKYLFGHSASKVKALQFATKTPPTLSSKNWISSLSALETIYIPTGSLNAYSTATNWSNFTSKFVEKEI